ncbi:hypothetical protein GGX14DRAFT_396679 [Mycena pura]|uniref:Alpha-type protein kinase domain-containing protein n=1 Tax=Mycena pura TaxID=153505 RepID=A0AAD6VA78_9AGAR|nr:hypothetical protein GGX14DRAFT_396679 [Mycena pura]
MPVCLDCSVDFPWLEDEVYVCNKCLELRDKSEIEKVSIREKPQCMSCSVVFSQLRNTLCNSCCHKLAQADSIPRIIFDLPGAAEQIGNFQTSDFTSDIWELAQGYKRIASDTRLGLPRTLNQSLQKTPAGITSAASKLIKIKALDKALPGIAKGMTRIQEAKEMREQGKKIKMIITLGISEGLKRIVLVPSMRLVHNAQEDLPIFDVIGTVISLIQEAHVKESPEAAKIYRTMVSFYAVETTTKYFLLTQGNISDGTISDLLAHYFHQQHISKAQYEAKTINMMLVVKRERLFPDTGSRSALSSSRHVPARISGEESGNSTSSVTRESFSSKRLRNVRSSAWRLPAPKSQFARNPPTFIEYTFKRYEVKVEGTDVTLWMPPNAPAEKVLVGSDWKAGLSIKNSKTTQNTVQEVYKTSFVGQGSAKNVIYARIGNEEYALGQSQDITLPTAENARMLRAELTNMYIGEVIRKEFFQCASDCDVNVPDFRFNVEGAILGVLEPLEAGHISASLGLPSNFHDFIATRYLPCSPVDKAVQKFTGNADCGNPPDHGDSLTAAIHAFTHFTLLYTGNGLVFCDLQGLFNREGIMMLIDPQSHSPLIKRIYQGPSLTARTACTGMEVPLQSSIF